MITLKAGNYIGQAWLRILFRGGYNFQNNRSILFKVTPNLQHFSAGDSKLHLSTMSDHEDKKSELKNRLTPLQYHVTQEKGTER